MTQSPITLHGSFRIFGAPQASPFVMKTEVQLKMAGLPYETGDAAPDQSPKGQIPFIGDGGDLIGDSTFIRAHIEEKYGIDLDTGLNEVERAQAWALERMLENNFYWVVVGERWLNDENFAKGPAIFFERAPAEMRAALCAQARESVRARRNGAIGRHSDDEIELLGAKTLQALSAHLGAKDFLFGGSPCGVDATAFGMLTAAMTPYFETRMRVRAEAYPNLVAYVERMMARFYPEFGWRI